jgi:hypothetical protein
MAIVIRRLRAPQRTMRAMRGVRYRGFQITLYNNHYYSFRYEWKVRPLGPTMLRLTAYRGRLRHVIHDPTSARRRAVALEDAKVRINELRAPFWTRR